MPTVTVGTDSFLYYEDSGVPRDSAHYSTIFLIHGIVYHTPVFRRLFSRAAAHNLRFIAITIPGYPNSTLTDAQVALLESLQSEDVAAGLAELASIIAFGIAHLIKTEHLPPPVDVDGVTSGGVRILAWSSGNVLLLSLLANISSLQPGINAVLERHVTSVVIYEVPCVHIGELRPQPEAYSPLEDMEVPPSEFVSSFMTWVSSYFEPLRGLAAVTPAAMHARKNLSTNVDGTPTTDTRYTPILDRLTPCEVAGATWPSIFARNPTPVPTPVTVPVYAQNLRNALFDTRGIWPRVEVLVLWSDMSPFYFSWAAKRIADFVEEPVKKGELRRKVRIVQVENANHLLHYEDPDRMARILASETKATSVTTRTLRQRQKNVWAFSFSRFISSSSDLAKTPKVRA